MIASVYIKDGNLHFYNESDSLSYLGGMAFELGKPLLAFVCYEPERFVEGFDIIVDAFDNEFAHIGAREPEFTATLFQIMGELQQGETYMSFYAQMLMDFVFTFIDSPSRAIEQLAAKIPGVEEKLGWAKDFTWPVPPPGKIYDDQEKRLFRAAKDAVTVMYKHFCSFQAFILHEIEILLHYRAKIKVPDDRPIDYIDILDAYHVEMFGKNYYIEQPFQTFYGRVATGEVEQLYAIDHIEDLFRFEFIKMVEKNIFIKKCKNCEHYFIPKRRADAEYCERGYGDTGRKCSEIGAMLRYERKVADNPIREAHIKAYRRFNSRVRTKKMTQAEFLAWSEEARRKRDACLAGELPFDEFVAWLEQGRIRKSRSKPQGASTSGQTGT